MTEFLEFNTKPFVVEHITVFDDLPYSALPNVSEMSALPCPSGASFGRDIRRYLKGGA